MVRTALSVLLVVAAAIAAQQALTDSQRLILRAAKDYTPGYVKALPRLAKEADTLMAAYRKGKVDPALNTVPDAHAVDGADGWLFPTKEMKEQYIQRQAAKIRQLADHRDMAKRGKLILPPPFTPKSPRDAGQFADEVRVSRVSGEQTAIVRFPGTDEDVLLVGVSTKDWQDRHAYPISGWFAVVKVENLGGTILRVEVVPAFDLSAFADQP